MCYNIIDPPDFEYTEVFQDNNGLLKTYLDVTWGPRANTVTKMLHNWCFPAPQSSNEFRTKISMSQISINISV